MRKNEIEIKLEFTLRIVYIFLHCLSRHVSRFLSTFHVLTPDNAITTHHSTDYQKRLVFSYEESTEETGIRDSGNFLPSPGGLGSTYYVYL